MTLVWIVGATLAGGLLSAALASLFLLLSAARRTWLLPHLVSFATGAMLAAALLGLLPEAAQRAGADHIEAIGAAVLAGIALFFVLEKLVLWRHCHTEDCEAHGEGHGHGHPQARGDRHADEHRDRAAGWIVLFGDGLHNAFDGVLIAAAFLTDVKLGLLTTVAITAHEVPQELGDLAVLLHAGMTPLRALWFNAASSLTSIIGGLVGFYALSHALEVLPYAISVAAASLLYVAVADLIPGLHRRVDPQSAVAQVVLIGGGVAVIGLAEKWLG
jgi:zinc and cadmium transporter